jgi:hypothetical protein
MSDATEKKTVAALGTLNAFVEQYLHMYELRGESDYTPNETEQMLIADAVHGLIGTERFIELLFAHRSQLRALRTERNECPACGRENKHGHWGSCKEKTQTAALLAAEKSLPIGLVKSLARLSQAIGNPAVMCTYAGTIEEALIDGPCAESPRLPSKCASSKATQIAQFSRRLLNLRRQLAATSSTATVIPGI